MHSPSAATVARLAPIAEQFVRARIEACALAEFPAEAPRDIEEAYCCQDLAIRKWPDPIAGWKVTSRFPKDVAEHLGDERFVGPVFRSSVLLAASKESVDCPVFEEGVSTIEPEIIVRVGGDVPPDKHDWSLDEALSVIDGLHVGVEIVSSPWATLLNHGLTAMAADFGGNAGMVVGPAVPNWRHLDQISVRFSMDRVFIQEGHAKILDDAVAGFAFALSRCARRGYPLSAGDYVTTGTMTELHIVRVGQQTHQLFPGVGEISCVATPRAPHRTPA